MLSILAFVGDPASRDNLDKLFASPVALDVCRDAKVVFERLARRCPHAFLTTLRTSEDRSTLPSIKKVRTTCPSLPIIAYLPFDRGNARLLPQAGRYGVDHVIFQNEEEQTAQAEGILRSLELHSVAQDMCRAIGDLINPEVDMLCQIILEEDSFMSLNELAQTIDKSTERLRQLFRAEGLVPPHILQLWKRALSAARLTENMECSPESIARMTGYSSPQALYTGMKRCTGQTLSEIRDSGGYPALLRKFRSEIRLASATRERKNPSSHAYASPLGSVARSGFGNR
jgi:AraC-like DNA-binding protein